MLINQKTTASIQIPKFLQSVLWSSNIDSLDLKQDQDYIIHQVLIYGALVHLRWLFKTYAKKEILETFKTSPYKSYYPARFHFVKDFILGLKTYKFNEKLYVQNTPRDFRYQKGQPIYQIVAV